MYCPPEYILKGEFHRKPATVWSLGILLFRMLCGRFPDSFDFYRTNLNTWSKPGLTEGEFFSTSTIQIQKCIGFIRDGQCSNLSQFSDLEIFQLRIRRADVVYSNNQTSLPSFCTECCHLICSLLQQKPERRLDLDRIAHRDWF